MKIIFFRTKKQTSEQKKRTNYRSKANTKYSIYSSTNNQEIKYIKETFENGIDKENSKLKSKTDKRFFENVTLIIFCCIYMLITIFSAVYLDDNSNKESVASPKKYTVCLDAGHGGRDGGAVGSFTKESDINLAITQKLTKLFIAGGFNVVNTRIEDICLSDENSPSFKLDDMKKRREIILSSNPDIVISIHCNKFSLPSCVGAQVFYQKGDNRSKTLAEIMTSYFINNLLNSRKITIAGDYYVLQNTNCPSILVECGYVSNPNEEKLLASDDYQQKLAYSIYSGTIKFLMTSVVS